MRGTRRAEIPQKPLIKIANPEFDFKITKRMLAPQFEPKITEANRIISEFEALLRLRDDELPHE